MPRTHIEGLTEQIEEESGPSVDATMLPPG
jgi:hypothetical protein